MPRRALQDSRLSERPRRDTRAAKATRIARCHSCLPHFGQNDATYGGSLCPQLAQERSRPPTSPSCTPSAVRPGGRFVQRLLSVARDGAVVARIARPRCLRYRIPNTIAKRATPNPQTTGEKPPTLTPRRHRRFASVYAQNPRPTAISAPTSSLDICHWSLTQNLRHPPRARLDGRPADIAGAWSAFCP